jgi:hypothetical protein
MRCTVGAAENFESRFCQFSADQTAFSFLSCWARFKDDFEVLFTLPGAYWFRVDKTEVAQ